MRQEELKAKGEAVSQDTKYGVVPDANLCLSDTQRMFVCDSHKAAIHLLLKLRTLAKSAYGDGPQSDGCEGTPEAMSRPQSDRRERALIWPSARSKLHGADSAQADAALSDCGICGRPIGSCNCYDEF
jgi:hypothetical protein